jgi:hypothetical protein
MKVLLLQKCNHKLGSDNFLLPSDICSLSRWTEAIPHANSIRDEAPTYIIAVTAGD